VGWRWVVVGVDGSQGADAALAYAAEDAARRRARLRIVSALQIPTAGYGGSFGGRVLDKSSLAAEPRAPRRRLRALPNPVSEVVTPRLSLETTAGLAAAALVLPTDSRS